MSLMSPSGLWLLCVVAGIAVIYFFRMPRRRFLVADLAPWLQVARAGKRMSSERRAMISLVIQLAIALALVFAFARPFFTGPEGGRLELVLVNLSASTRARDATPLKVLAGLEKSAPAGASRLYIEKHALQIMIRAMNPGDRMTVIGVGARTTIISSGESEPAVLERSVSALEARNETAAFPSACQLAVELAKTERNVRVTVIDDGSTESADLAALNKLPEAAGKIRCVKVGKSAENVGIVGFKSRKKFNSDEIETTVAIFNSARQPLKIPVELYLDGKVQRAAIAEIGAGGTEVVNFSIDYRRGGTLKARLAVQDAIQEDNEAVDFLPPPHRMKVALVTREPMDEKAANDYYLARVLRSDTGVEGGFLAAADYKKIAQDKTALKSQFEAIVFDNWAPPAGELPPCHALFVNAETADIPVTVKGVLGDHPLIRKWDEGYPLMNYLNLRDVFLRRAKDLQSNDKATDVVAELVSSPLILAREIERRKVAYLGFNPADSDIQFKKELPLLVLNVFEWFKRGVEPVTQIVPGEAMSIPIDSAWKSVTVQPPDDAAPQTIDIPPDAENVMFFQTLRPGIYRYKADAEKVFAGGFAVNFGSQRASNVSAADDIRIGTVDERGGIANNRADATTLDALVEHHASAGLWLYFAAFALVLMVAENYLFHRRIFF